MPLPGMFSAHISALSRILYFSVGYLSHNISFLAIIMTLPPCLVQSALALTPYPVGVILLSGSASRCVSVRHRMSFGICSAPEVFQCRMHELIEGLHGVEVMADDFVTVGFGDASDEAVVDHEKNLEALGLPTAL